MASKGKTSGSGYNYSSRSHQSTSHSGKIQSFKIPKLSARNPAQEKRESSVGPANRVVKKYEKQRSSFILPPGVESQRLLNLKNQLKVTSAAALKKQRAMAAERARASKQDSESELEEQEVSDVENVMEENARSRSETQKTKPKRRSRCSSTSQSPEPQHKTRNRSTSESSSRSPTPKPRARKRSISPKPRSRSPKSTKRRARKSRSRSAVRRPAPSTQARVSKKHTRSKSMERAYNRKTERSRSSDSEEERERPPPPKKTLKLKHTSPESRMIQTINALGSVACKMMESLKTEGKQAVRIQDFENDIRVFYNIAYPDKNLISLNLKYPDLFKLLVEQYKKDKEELKQFEEACKLLHKSYATQPKEQPTHSDLLKTIKAVTVKRFQKAKASETDYKQGHATYTATAAPGTSVSTSHQVQGSRSQTSSLCSTGEEAEHETAANFIDLNEENEKIVLKVKKSKSKLSSDNLVLPIVSVLQKQRLELQRLDRRCRVEEDVHGIGASMSYNLPSLSRNTLVANTVSARKSRTVFFLTFAKQELLTENHQLCLNEALVFKQHLFELFLFLTKYTGGSVYQIMLEPVVLQDQEEKLNPHLGYEMSTGVLFLFVLPRCKSLETLPFDVQLINAKQQKVIAGAKKSALPHVQNAADKAEKAMNSSAVANTTIEYRLNEDQTLGNAKHTLVKAIKKLICHTMGLITMEDLMLKGSGEALFPYINFATNYFKHTGASALPMKTSFRQPAQQNFSFPKDFGVQYITEIAWRYFMYRDACLAQENDTIDDCDVDDDPLPGTCELCLARTLWRFHVSNMNGCQILQSFRRSTAEGALTRLLDGLADCEPDSTAFKLQGSSKIMIFKLETMDLFPSQYRNVELPCFRPFTDD